MFALSDDDSDIISDDDRETDKVIHGRPSSSISAGQTLNNDVLPLLWSRESQVRTIANTDTPTASDPPPLFVLDADPNSDIAVNISAKNSDDIDRKSLSKESKSDRKVASKNRQKRNKQKAKSEASILPILSKEGPKVYVDLKTQWPKSSRDLEKRRTKLQARVEKNKVEEVMKKSVITKEFLKQEKVLPYYESVQAERKRRKVEREKTRGVDWFNMPATEMTEERKRDLEILMMRNSLDTKNYYRHEDRKVLPKYFQVGTVIEHATDYYTDRVPKKQRKQTIADELLADAAFRKKSKERYKAVMQSKPRFRPENRPRPKRPKKVNTSHDD